MTDSVSKAAVNMWVKKLSVELASVGQVYSSVEQVINQDTNQQESFIILPVHPGYVRTGMNKGTGEIFQEESVEKLSVNTTL